MAEEAVRAGMPPQSVHFFEQSEEAGEFAPANSPARRRHPVQGFARRAHRASAWRKSWRNHAVLPALRKAVAAGVRIPRLSLRHLAHRLRQPDRAVPLRRAGPLADRQAAPVSDRPVHPRRRPQIAPEESRHAHHGRRADHRFDRYPHAALGGPAQLVRLDRGLDAAGLRRDRFRGRLRQSRQAPQSGADGAAQDAVPGRHWLSSWRRC